MGLVFVKQQTARIIERFGAFKGVLEPGFHLSNALTDSYAGYYHGTSWVTEIPLYRQTINPKAEKYRSRDQSFVTVDIRYDIQITDPRKFVYSHGNYPMARIDLEIQDVIKVFIESRPIDEVLVSRSALEAAVAHNLRVPAGLCEVLGFDLIMFKVENLGPDPERSAIDRQMDIARRAAELQRIKNENESNLLLEKENDKRKREWAVIVENNKVASGRLDQEQQIQGKRIKHEAETKLALVKTEAHLEAEKAKAEAQLVAEKAKAAHALDLATAQNALEVAKLNLQISELNAQAAAMPEIQRMRMIRESGGDWQTIDMHTKTMEALGKFGRSTHVISADALPLSTFLTHTGLFGKPPLLENKPVNE